MRRTINGLMKEIERLVIERDKWKNIADFNQTVRHHAIQHACKCQDDLTQKEAVLDKSMRRVIHLEICNTALKHDARMASERRGILLLCQRMMAKTDAEGKTKFGWVREVIEKAVGVLTVCLILSSCAPISSQPVYWGVYPESTFETQQNATLRKHYRYAPALRPMAYNQPEYRPQTQGRGRWVANYDEPDRQRVLTWRRLERPAGQPFHSFIEDDYYPQRDE